MLSHGDLFSGIGGFSIAAGWAGFRTVFFSEVEPYCCRLLAERWPGVPNLGDIRRADFSVWRDRIDVLSGGFPCQPFSLAGKQRGRNDDRDLWPAMFSAVSEIRPLWVICENVPGIISLGQLDRVCLDLESLGYQMQPFSVPANSVGAKHLRYRIFVVAHSERNGLQGWKIKSENRFSESGKEQLAGFLQSGSRPSLSSARAYGKRYGVYGRPHTIKRNVALGNSVVPQQAYPFFAAIAQVEIQRAREATR
jgi:DNA (cytosine-5)-methyltransferase 1